jgi:hypothetical protein
MKESWTYQAIVAEAEADAAKKARAEEARRMLRRLGERRFGSPSASASAVLDGISDAERLERMFDAALVAESWDAVLATL